MFGGLEKGGIREMSHALLFEQLGHGVEQEMEGEQKREREKEREKRRSRKGFFFSYYFHLFLSSLSKKQQSQKK